MLSSIVIVSISYFIGSLNNEGLTSTKFLSKQSSFTKLENLWTQMCSIRTKFNQTSDKLMFAFKVFCTYV